MKVGSGRQNNTTWKGRQKKKKKLEVNYCKHKTICYHFIPQERSVNVFCVQIETALSGRHCILKQGHDVFITLSRSIHVTLTQPGQNTRGLRSTMPRQEGDRSLSVPKFPNSHTTGGISLSIMNLIENKSVRSELEVVI